MSDNNKFVAMLMGQDSIDFDEVLRSLPEEEQEAFVDFLIDILVVHIKQVRDLPLEIKVQGVLLGIKNMPTEVVSGIAVMLVETET